MVAASKGRQELVKRYLAAGAFVNLQVLLGSETSFFLIKLDQIGMYQDKARDTALILACRNDHLPVVETLLQK